MKTHNGSGRKPDDDPSASSPGRRRREPVDGDTYYNHIIRARNTGDYFLFFRSFNFIPGMSRIDSHLLQDLMNLVAMKQRARHNPNGWKADRYSRRMAETDFYLCTNEYLRKTSNWTDKELKVHIGRLRDLGFVEVVMAGVPAKRYVRLDIIRIEAALDGVVLEEWEDEGVRDSD